MSKFRRRLLMSASSEDTYILNISSVSGEPSPIFDVTAGEKGVTVTYLNDVRYIEPNTTTKVDFSNLGSSTTGDIVFKGSILSVYPSYRSVSGGGTTSQATINYIIKWFIKQQSITFEKQFVHQHLTFDIVIPKNIKKIIESTFSLTKFTGIEPKTLVLHENIEDIYRISPEGYSTGSYFSNSTLVDNIYYINNYALCPRYKYDNTTITSYTFKSDTKLIAEDIFVDHSSLFENSYTNVTSLTFNTPAGAELKIGKRLFYNKSARAVTIYADNQNVYDHLWGVDNLTTTVYKLDGVTVVPRLTAPTVSLTDNILTITPVTNATKYIIYTSTLSFETTDTTIDLSNYFTASGTYLIYVYVLADNYVSSVSSTSVSYVVA